MTGEVWFAGALGVVGCAGEGVVAPGVVCDVGMVAVCDAGVVAVCDAGVVTVDDGAAGVAAGRGCCCI